MVEEEEDEPAELMNKPREYKVKFSFPNPPPLNPPILGAYGETPGAQTDLCISLFQVRSYISPKKFFFRCDFFV